MATNNFLPFCPTDTGTNLLNEADYTAAADRVSGNKPGVASSKLNNKALRQACVIASQVAQYVSDITGADMIDDGTTTTLLANMLAAFGQPNSSLAVKNLGLTATVGASALTIALKQADAATNPTAANPVGIGFRSSTLTAGAFNMRSATAATSLVVSSGSTLGQVSTKAGYIYIYAIDNAGAIELAVSSTKYDEGTLVTTVAEGGAGAADDAYTIYSTTARSNVPIRLIGRALSTQTTAGTWAAAMTELSVIPFFTGRQSVVGTAQTSNGTTTSNTFAAPTNTPTVTFKPGKTGRYKIACSGIGQNGSGGEDNWFRINATAGTPVVVMSEESCFTAPGVGYRVPFSVWQEVWLTAGTSYTFQLECKVSAGTLTLANSFLAGGIALIAEQAD